MGPPDNALPSSFPLALTLARTDEFAISAQGGLAYPTGFAFRVITLRRKAVELPAGDPFNRMHSRRGELSDDLLRFGVQFSDGSKATTFDMHRGLGAEGKPAGPVLMQRG